MLRPGSCDDALYIEHNGITCLATSEILMECYHYMVHHDDILQTLHHIHIYIADRCRAEDERCLARSVT